MRTRSIGTRPTGEKILLQTQMMPWSEVKPGMVLKNYGHAFHLSIYFVEKLDKDFFVATYLLVEQSGEIFIQRNRVMRKMEWNEYKNKYDGNNGFNNRAILIDELRESDDLQYIIKSVFFSLVKLEYVG